MHQTRTRSDRGTVLTGQASTQPGGERSRPDLPRSSRRRWWWLLAIVVVGGGAAAWLLTNDDGVAGTAAPPAALRFEEVVVADLIEEDSYGATLGTIAADPIRTQVSGTVTWMADTGTTLVEGDVVFVIDGQPVVLLMGEVPAYRDLATVEEVTVAGLANRMAGTVTRVADPGVFVQGDILYWVNEEPVILLYGDLPQYRVIDVPRQGDVSGPDVLQLKEALVALGYDPDGVVGLGETFGGRAEDMVERWQEDIGANIDGSVGLGEVIYASGPVEVIEFLIVSGDVVGSGQAVAELPDDEEVEILEGDDVLQLEAALVRLGFDASGSLVADGVWDGATGSAVEAWQESIGAEVDGIVGRGEVIFLPATVRVIDQLASIGSIVNAGGTVLGISSADKLVTMNLPAADQGIIEAGARVTVELPDGTEVAATVIEVASVATTGANNNTVFVVTIALDSPSAAEGLDEAPVDVLIVTDSVLGVKAVPVTALLVLAEGGYAVEKDVGGGNTDLVGVVPGFFADGLVEVQSSGLQFGDLVVIP